MILFSKRLAPIREEALTYIYEHLDKNDYEINIGWGNIVLRKMQKIDGLGPYFAYFQGAGLGQRAIETYTIDMICEIADAMHTSTVKTLDS